MRTLTQYTAMTALLALSAMPPLSMANASVTSQADSTTSEPPPTEGMTSRELLEYHNERQRRLIAEMWERSQPEKDRGGMIDMKMFRLPGKRLIHPLPPDPLRRDAFDGWCDRIGITQAVPAETREVIWREYVNQINRVMTDDFYTVFALSRNVGPESGIPPDRATAARYSTMVEHSITAVQNANRAEDQMFGMLRTVENGRFADEVEAWHLYRRWERTSIFKVELSGAEHHLSRLIESLSIDWPSRYLQRAYEMEIASAAERRYSYSLSSTAPLYEMLVTAFYNDRDERYDPASPEGREARAEYERAAVPMRRQRLQHQQRMYAVNARYVALLSLLLDRTDAELVYDTFMYAAFPEHFPDQYDLRAWFDELLDEQPVGRDMRRSIGELRQTYMAARLGIDQSLIRTIHRHEQHFMLERSRSRQEREHHEREIEFELRRRYENAVTFAVRLVELIEHDERLDWVKDDLEELLETDLTRTW